MECGLDRVSNTYCWRAEGLSDEVTLTAQKDAERSPLGCHTLLGDWVQCVTPEVQAHAGIQGPIEQYETCNRCAMSLRSDRLRFSCGNGRVGPGDHREAAART